MYVCSQPTFISAAYITLRQLRLKYLNTICWGLRQHVLLSILEAGGQKLGYSHGLVLMRVSLQIADCCLLVINTHGGKRGRQFFETSFRSLIPVKRASPHDLDTQIPPH